MKDFLINFFAGFLSILLILAFIAGFIGGMAMMVLSFTGSSIWFGVGAIAIWATMGGLIISIHELN